VIEEDLFWRAGDLFSGLDCVFFDTTPFTLREEGGETIGELGHSKGSPSRPQSDGGGGHSGRAWSAGLLRDVAGEHERNVTTLVPVIKRLRNRFGIGPICIVSDRGMISAETMAYLEEEKIPYILGARMRRSKEVKEEVLSRAGRYREVHPEGVSTKDPSPLKVKEVIVRGTLHRLPQRETGPQGRRGPAGRSSIPSRRSSRPTRSLSWGNKGYPEVSEAGSRHRYRQSGENRRGGAVRREVGSQDKHHADDRAGGPQVQGTAAGRTGLTGT